MIHVLQRLVGRRREQGVDAWTLNQRCQTPMVKPGSSTKQYYPKDTYKLSFLSCLSDITESKEYRGIYTERKN